MNPAWLLPEHIEDILPPYARQAEALRRRLLDLFDGYGYDLVRPPLIEYLDSLLTGAAGDLDLKTFKMVDGLSGRMLGLRADSTPQAARIDAHLLNRQGVNRLCYAGPVLHAKPAGLMASREPYQVGAELFGHAGIEADREILQLLLAALAACALPEVRVSLGHVGLFRALAAAAGVTPEIERPLFRALRAKKGRRTLGPVCEGRCKRERVSRITFSRAVFSQTRRGRSNRNHHPDRFYRGRRGHLFLQQLSAPGGQSPGHRKPRRG